MSDHASEPKSINKRAIVLVVITTIVVVSTLGIKDPLLSRAAIVAGACLTLWLSEMVPPFVPTFMLWVMAPLLLEPFGDQFSLTRVLTWSAEPVLALFLGGFTLGAAARRYGIDRSIADVAVRLSRGNCLLLLLLAASATALLSMWMSNIAAAAMMIAALRPLFEATHKGDRFRRALLVGVAMGANFGGIATPIGTGPNAIAIAEISSRCPITFIAWMSFAVPLAAGLLAAALLLLVIYFRVGGETKNPNLPRAPLSHQARWVVGLFFATVALWLTEPIHDIASPLIALAVTAALFGSGLLGRDDLTRIDWSTLVLIAGGLGLGRLLEHSGLVNAAAALFPWASVPHFVVIFALCFSSALLSALMSNTGTSAMLIPLGLSLAPEPSTAILIAMSASLGVPFVISTPPNAMVYGEGGVKTSDLLVPGLILMIAGCLLVSLTGPTILNWIGIP